MAMVDGGGPVIQYVKVKLLLWGDVWLTAPPQSVGDMEAAIEWILAGGYLRALFQYRGAGEYSKLAKPTLVIGSPGPVNDYTLENVSDAVWNNIDAGGLPDPEDESGHMLYFVVAPPGYRYTNHNAWGSHFDATDYDFPSGTEHAWVAHVMTDGTLDTFTARFTHELVEALVDPDGSGFQVAPADEHDWNEIGDVCEGQDNRFGPLLVASYWSEEAGTCVLPFEEQNDWEVTCINKQPRDNIFHPIQNIGGIAPDGTRFLLAEKQVIEMIEAGRNFYVNGADGSRAQVAVLLHYPPGYEVSGKRYLATSADSSKLDNLLSLPECPL
jgi:hypothetical protein